MPSSRRARVDDVGKEGREDTKGADNPDRPTPDSLGRPEDEATKQFEAAAFDAVRGGPGNVNAGHPGHGKGSGGPSFAAQGSSRGHVDSAALFTAQKGHAPKRSGAGESTPAASPNANNRPID